MRLLAALAAALWLGGAAASPDVVVNIDNFAFGPAEVTIAPGTMVTWTNRDDIPHTVTSADMPRVFKSEVLDTNGHFSHRFSQPGRFAYFCSLHAHMQGLVVVK